MHARDDWWHRKYEEDREGRAVPVQAGAAADQPDIAGEAEPTGIHLPDPSYWPMVVAAGITVLGYGLVFLRPSGAADPTYSAGAILLLALGAVVLLSGMFGWVLEPLEEPGREHAH